MDKLKQIEIFVRVDPNALASAIPTTTLVKSLKDFTILLEHVEARWIELKGDFENFKDTLVPPLLKNDNSIKGYIPSGG